MKLHLGCADNIKPGFLNYDLRPGPGGITHDLRTSLPHSNNSVDFIFSEHFLEHIPREDGLRLLKECYRVLKQAGKLRITTPDLTLLASDYLQGKIDRWVSVWAPKTPAQFLNEGLTAWEHKFTYDLNELLIIFREAGFQNPAPAKHGEHELRGWTGELTVEAIK